MNLSRHHHQSAMFFPSLPLPSLVCIYRHSGILCLLLLLLLLSRFSCVRLCATPIDGSPSGSPVPGIPQARTLEWVAISFSNACMHAKSLQLCPTLCGPMDSSPPGSFVHGIPQARMLEWVAISFHQESKKWENFGARYLWGSIFHGCPEKNDIASCCRSSN